MVGPRTSSRPGTGVRGRAALAVALLLLVASAAVVPAYAKPTGDFVEGAGGPAKGKLLVAARHLRGLSSFAESVILLVDHGPEGSTGLIINRPSRMRLSEVLPSRGDVKTRGDALWVGGPVQPTRLMLLARAHERLPDGFPIFAEVKLVLTKRGLDRAFGRGIPPAAVRAYAGFAGWSPGQLDREIADGDWYVVDAEVKSVFSTEPRDLWSVLIEGAAGRWVRRVGAQAPT